MKLLTERIFLSPFQIPLRTNFVSLRPVAGFAFPGFKVCSLAGEIIGIQRQPSKPGFANGPVRILCVSTLDPRKNHAGLIEAFNQACEILLPGRELLLDLCGRSLQGCPLHCRTR